MPAYLRTSYIAFAAVALGSVGYAAEQMSPFLPPASAMVNTASSTENLEFAGVNAMGAKTYVNVYDKALKKGRWIAISGTENNITVLAYDSRREQIVIKTGDTQKTLTLRKATGTLNGPTPVAVMPAPGGFSVPSPAVSGPVAPPPVPTPGDVAANTAQTTPTAEIAPAPAAASKQEGPAKPLTVARQEEEARMLVSDLLEIGMAQRKAYEEAQKKASEQATAAASTPTTPPGS